MDKKISQYIESLPIDPVDKQRIKMTVSCTDSDSLPRVPNAGEILDGPEGLYQIMHNGVKVIKDAYIGRWVTETIKLLKGAHEPQEEKAFAEILKHISKNGTMIELGSWWSYYSLWFQKEIKNSTNYMIEPDPNNLDVGVRNFAMNGMTGKHFNKAIGNESKEPVPYLCYESDDIERLIPIITVDDFIERESINSVDLLLADIQGFELQMLQGSTKSITKGLIRFIVLSTHHHSISNDPLMHQKCLNLLLDYGANILVEHNISESFSGDGLIVASFNPADRKLPIIEVSRNRPGTSLFKEIEYDLVATQQEKEKIISELNRVQVELAESQNEREAIREDMQGIRSDLQEIRAGRDSYLSELKTVRTEKEELQKKVHIGISEQEHLILDLDRKKIAISKLQDKIDLAHSQLNEGKTERDKIQIQIKDNLIIQEKLQSQIDEVGLIRNQLQNQLNNVETEKKNLQTEFDSVYQDRHRYWSELDLIYNSRSWKLLSSIRKISEKGRFLKRRLPQSPRHPLSFFIAKSLRWAVKSVKNIPWGSTAVNKFKARYPHIWIKLSIWANRTTKTEPVVFLNIQNAPENEITSINKEHFKKLFLRELSQRQKNTEVGK